MEKFNRPLLWLDADAIVLKKPSLVFENIDMAFYFNDLPSKCARSATIYIAPTRGAKTFIKKWHQACLRELSKREDIDYGDTSVLISTLNQFPLRVGTLPLGYSAIFDKDPLSLEQITILQFQASRTARMPKEFWQHLSGSQLKNIRLEYSMERRS
jgi:hypothetical protein